MITSYDFGRIEIDGRTYKSDIVITPGGINESWWRKSGHLVELRDIEEMLEAKPEIIILGQGKPGLMKATDDLKKHLEEQGICLIEEPTLKAVRTFNKLQENGDKVCGGFHLTC